MKKFGAYMADVMPAIRDEMVKAQNKSQSEENPPAQGGEPKPGK